MRGESVVWGYADQRITIVPTGRSAVDSAESSSPLSAAVRFVPLDYVEKTLSISKSQAYALVRTGDLRAIRIGGRNQWRVELTELEAYIKRAYALTAAELAAEDTTDQD